MRVLHVASEVAPYSQSGGLAQVAGALPKALREAGANVAVLTPLYQQVRQREVALRPTGVQFEAEFFGQRLRADIATADDGTFFLDCPALYERPGLYADDDKVEHPDNAIRFAFLARAAVAIGDAIAGGALDVVHAHDWQTGLIAAYLELETPATRSRPKSVFTIHNLAFQGVVSKDHVEGLGLDWSLFTADGLEYWDQVSFLKAGASFSDQVTTVSPTYADEITRLEFGQGLDGYFRYHREKLTGILNGIDYDEWNPESDRSIAKRYNARSIATGKRACRAALAARWELELDEQTLLLGVVSRLSEQKGPDEIAALGPALESLDAAVVVLGSGDAAIENQFRALAEVNPRVAVYIGFDEARAHQVFAGSDALLMPSRFEPCGLAQLSAMRYGTVPIVRAVGGLADSVTDGVTGFSYGPSSSLRIETKRAAETFKSDPKRWTQMARRGMQRDSSWRSAAASYLDLYRRLVADKTS